MRQRSYMKLLAVCGTLLFFMVVLTGWRSSAVAPQGNPAAEWQRSKHANRETAIAEATVERRSTLAAHCRRCQSEQGFIAGVPQLLAGDPGYIKKPDGSTADVAYLQSLGLTVDRVQPLHVGRWDGSVRASWGDLGSAWRTAHLRDFGSDHPRVLELSPDRA